MAFQVGQKVKIKSTSPWARLTGVEVMTVVRLASNGRTIYVKGEEAGRWVGADELDPLSGEGLGT